MYVLSSHDAKVSNSEKKTGGHYKTAATKVLIFFNKSLCEKNLILNISEYSNMLISLKKRRTAANSFLVLVF